MRASARILGQELGLNAQEFNHALKEAGFLSGEPGAYAVTEKGAKFAAEQYHSRGTGGYAWFNPSWETRTWDDAILGALSLSEDRKRQIRQAVADARRARAAARSTVAVGVATPSTDVVRARSIHIASVTRVAAPLAATAAAAYGLSKAVPVARRLWARRATPSSAPSDESAGPAF